MCSQCFLSSLMIMNIIICAALEDWNPSHHSSSVTIIRYLPFPQLLQHHTHRIYWTGEWNGYHCYQAIDELKDSPHPLPPLWSTTCMSLPLMCPTSPPLPVCNINPDLQQPSSVTAESLNHVSTRSVRKEPILPALVRIPAMSVQGICMATGMGSQSGWIWRWRQ